MTLGEQLRKIRKRCGYTVDKLSQLADIHPSAIRLYEYGFRQPGIDNLRKLCNAMHVTLTVFHHCEPFTPRHRRIPVLLDPTVPQDPNF